MSRLAWFSLCISVVFLLNGCAHAPGISPQESPEALLAQVCEVGQSVREAKGTGWMRAKSNDQSGQFSAAIHVTPSHLTLEVLQPFGGTFSTLTVDGNAYRVEVPGKPERNQSGKDSWSGIPLRWAIDLFLGKVPCPGSANSETKLARTEEGFVAELGPEQEKFEYRMEIIHDHIRPTHLHWSKGQAVVDFDFSDFDAKTGSPEKWQAVSHFASSGALGELKFRWQEHETIP